MLHFYPLLFRLDSTRTYVLCTICTVSKIRGREREMGGGGGGLNGLFFGPGRARARPNQLGPRGDFWYKKPRDGT